jgi:hypothetical protein
MTKNILTLRKTGRLVCAWVATGNPRTPLACVWAQASARGAAKTSASPNDDSGRLPQSA